MTNLTVFKSLFILFFIFSASEILLAQKIAGDTGKVEFVQEYKVKELLAKHAEVNAKAPIEGYRIKIHFGADKNKAKEIKAKFISKFPEFKAYEKYDQPNFNIRVGDFRTKLDAYKALKEIQLEFPSAFLVQDDIELPDLDSEASK
ncbi:MAG TPA: SPOR domain-containing protein [Bacteroidia bacterium]|jgi:hypothetical protein